MKPKTAEIMLKMKQAKLSRAERETAKAKKRLDTAKNASKKLTSLSNEIRKETSSGVHDSVSFKATFQYSDVLSAHSAQAQEQIKQLETVHKEQVKIQNTARIQKDGAEKLRDKVVKKEKLRKEKLREMRRPPRINKKDDDDYS